MDNAAPVILQLRDSLTGRVCALRIDRPDAGSSLAGLLDQYLKHAPLDALLQENRITQQSADILFSLQDLVYATTDNGRLMDMFSGVAFQQKGCCIDLQDIPVSVATQVEDTQVLALELTIDRAGVGYDRNWAGFHKRRWQRQSKAYEAFVGSTLESNCGRSEAEAILQLDSLEHKLRFLNILARRVWDSDFENYSRFTGDKLIFKSGDETLRNIMAGAGGICTEKVQALKFITDHYGLQSEYIIGGDNARDPVPVDRLRELLTTFDFRFSKRYMRYWQHIALLYSIDGRQVLVDATNGNIPFLFLLDDDAECILGYANKLPVTVRMVEFDEDFYYHRVPQDIPERLLFALEGWIPDADMLQVFDNELGLYLSQDFFVSPAPFKNEREFSKLQQQYTRVCQQVNLPSCVSMEWTLDSSLGHQFMAAEPEVGQKVLLSQEHLLNRYNQWDGPGHRSGLVVIRLRNQGEE